MNERRTEEPTVTAPLQKGAECSLYASFCLSVCLVVYLPTCLPVLQSIRVSVRPSNLFRLYLPPRHSPM